MSRRGSNSKNPFIDREAVVDSSEDEDCRGQSLLCSDEDDVDPSNDEPTASDVEFLKDEASDSNYESSDSELERARRRAADKRRVPAAAALAALSAPAPPPNRAPIHPSDLDHDLLPPPGFLQQSRLQSPRRRGRLDFSRLGKRRSIDPPAIPAEPKSNEEAQKPKKPRQPPKFRMDGKQYCLTFPQCSLSKEEALANILKYAEPDPPESFYDHVVVAQETHKDGEKHLHCYIQFFRRKQFTDPACFDFVANQHGNYKTVKRGQGGRLGWLRYICKEDKAPATFNCDLQALLRKQKGSGSFQQVVDHIVKSQDLSSVEPELLPTVALHLQKLQKFQVWYYATQQRPIKWPGRVYMEGPVDLREQHWSLATIVDWLNQNIFPATNNTQRQRKQSQLYIWGPPNFGKTWLIDWLSQYLRIYRASIDEDFYDGYDDLLFDMIVFDEWKGQRKMQHMNQLLEGVEMRLKIKGAQVVKRKNLPMIIASNFPPGTAYSGISEERLSSFRARILEVKLLEPLRLDLLKFEVDSPPPSPSQSTP